VRQKAASQTNQPKLALLAIPAQPDVFTKVKAEIDKMVAELQTQQKDTDIEEVEKQDLSAVSSQNEFVSMSQHKCQDICDFLVKHCEFEVSQRTFATICSNLRLFLTICQAAFAKFCFSHCICDDSHNLTSFSHAYEYQSNDIIDINICIFLMHTSTNDIIVVLIDAVRNNCVVLCCAQGRLEAGWRLEAAWLEAGWRAGGIT